GKDWLPGDRDRSYLDLFTQCMGAFCALYWLIGVNDPIGRMASLAFAIGCLYFSCLNFVYCWYWPPASMLGLVAVARPCALLLGGPSLFRGRLARMPDWRSLAGLSLVGFVVFSWLLNVEVWYLPTALVLSCLWLPGAMAAAGNRIPRVVNLVCS